ncbi:unnamed protein product [Hymenolepis diminuta]|uniref:Ig-like domain-containing protein n=1 Tax=Hymenolepis diminuta TaxID=6216 RepID=A0A3P7BBN4_HYMDI|nr:unnamed protein product [Hymenolepis diminuta]
MPRARTISTTTVVEVTEAMPEVVEEKPKESVQEEFVSESSKFHAGVFGFSKPLSRVATPSDQHILELECEIQGYTQPVSLKWLHNGRELVDSDKYEMVYFESTGTARLIVKDVKLEDVGEYECFVVGNVLEEHTGRMEPMTIFTKAEITDKTLIVEVTQEVEIEEEEEVEELEKEEAQSPVSDVCSPIFETELTPVKVIEGEEIYLSAIVKGKPQPLEVIWKHNGAILQPSKTDAVLFYEPEQGLCELTISEAFVEDAGIYEVQASNEFGMAVSQTEVLVNVPEESKRPEVREVPLKEAAIVDEEVQPEEIPVPLEGTSIEASATATETEKLDISKPKVGAKPTQEELVEKDKSYEFKIGAKGKVGKKKKTPEEFSEEKSEVVQPSAPAPSEDEDEKDRSQVDGGAMKLAPKATYTAAEMETESMRLAEVVDQPEVTVVAPQVNEVPEDDREEEEQRPEVTGVSYEVDRPESTQPKEVAPVVKGITEEEKKKEKKPVEPEEKREKDIMDGKKVPKPTATAEIEAIAIPEEEIQDQPEVIEVKPEVTEGPKKPEDKEETVPKVTGVSVQVDKRQMTEPREEKTPEVEQKKEKSKIAFESSEEESEKEQEKDVIDGKKMPKPTAIGEEMKMEAIPEAKITEHPEVTEVKPGVTAVSEKPEEKGPKVTGVIIEVDKPQAAEPKEEKVPQVEEIVKREKKKKEESPLGLGTESEEEKEKDILDGKKVPKSKVTVEEKETEAVPEGEALEQPEVTKVKLEVTQFLEKSEEVEKKIPTITGVGVEIDRTKVPEPKEEKAPEVDENAEEKEKKKEEPLEAPKESREEVIEKDKEYEFQVGVKGKPGEQRKKTEEIRSEEEIPEEPQPIIETAVEAPTEYTGPPSQPINVHAEAYPKKTPIRSQSIELSWDQPDGNPSDEFTIEVRLKGTGTWIEREITLAPDRKVSLKTDNLKEYTDYEFRITAKNKSGKSEPSGPSNPIQLGIPLEFVRELPDIVVTQAPTEDEPIVFECELSRPSREKVEWRKDGKVLPKQMPEHVHVIEEKNGTVHRIVFDDVKVEDTGDYTIKAEDVISKGKMEMRSELNFQHD